METNSLYIHIPFCEHMCSYCDFCKIYYNEEIARQYLVVLEQELHGLQISHPLKTIYIGGGTPSSLSLKLFTKLMDMIQPYIDENTIEVCMEVNPESMNQEKLSVFLQGHGNRLSIGVQSFQEHLTKNIERFHTSAQVFDLILTARNMGLHNISIDLMYGLPKQTMADIKADLRIVKQLAIPHVSYYSLILEDHTVLKNCQYQGIEEDDEERINTYIDDTLENMGLYKYEISNYARDGYTSKHNLCYWHFDNYYGIGLGASGKIDSTLYEHNRNISSYLKNTYTVKETYLDKDDCVFTNIMMSLRLVEGVDIEKIKQCYGVNILEKYHSVIEKYQKLDMLKIEMGRLKCTKESIKLLNSILVDFM